MSKSQNQPGTRRTFLSATVTLAAAAVVPFEVRAQATKDLRGTEKDMLAAIEKFSAGKQVGKGRVKLEVPPLVDNGNTVAISVAVDSPMTEADHVKSIVI